VTDALPADDILARLQSAGAGEIVWLPVAGRTFAPLLRPGDRIGVARMEGDAPRRGDLLLVLRDGEWAVRVVASPSPLRLRTLRGGMDDAPAEVHGRVAAIRRGERTIPFAARRRAAAWTLQQVASAARTILRPALGFARSSRATRGIRERSVGPLHVRRVRADDADAVDAFAAENLPRMHGYIARQLRGRWRTDGLAMAAFDARGAVRGFLFVDDYAAEGVDLPGQWIRAVAVAPGARRLGLARELVRAACAEAHRAGLRRVYADVLADNEASLALFRGLGFTEAPGWLAGRANAVLAAPGDVPRTIFESALPLADPRP
jgi:ribosomal protein S18 acetylase RimI-like enzyme